MHRISLVLATALMALPTFAQNTVSTPMVSPQSTPAPNISSVLLRQDTPVELMAVKEVSTADVSTGTHFKLRVNKAVVLEGMTVIPVGAWAFGQVVDAVDSGGLGKSGQMTARLLYVQTGNAQIPLSGDLSAKGTGAGSAGLAILFTGWAGFFHRGNNAKIKAGEILNGFIAEDAWLDLSGTAIERLSAPKPAETKLSAASAPVQ